MKTKHAREIREGIRTAKRYAEVWGDDAPEQEAINIYGLILLETHTTVEYDRGYDHIMRRHIAKVYERRKEKQNRELVARMNALRPIIEGDMDHEDFS